MKRQEKYTELLICDVVLKIKCMFVECELLQHGCVYSKVVLISIMCTRELGVVAIIWDEIYVIGIISILGCI